MARSKLTAKDIRVARGLRRVRLENGWHLPQAASLLEISVSHLDRVENLQRRWSGLLEMSAARLGVSLEDLMAPCPRCHYCPYEGYTCNRCGTSGDLWKPEQRGA